MTLRALGRSPVGRDNAYIVHALAVNGDKYSGGNNVWYNVRVGKI